MGAPIYLRPDSRPFATVLFEHYVSLQSLLNIDTELVFVPGKSREIAKNYIKREIPGFPGNSRDSRPFYPFLVYREIFDREISKHFTEY